MNTEKVSKSLTDYHYERSKAAQKAVEEMAKHPLSLEQKKEQVRRLKEGGNKN